MFLLTWFLNDTDTWQYRTSIPLRDLLIGHIPYNTIVIEPDFREFWIPRR